MSTFVNSEDLEEMQHYASGSTLLLKGKKIFRQRRSSLIWVHIVCNIARLRKKTSR